MHMDTQEPAVPEHGPLARRLGRAVERILEDERLTADLEDDAARVLIDWAISCAKQVVGGTIELDDVQAEEVTTHRLRAIRRMMRTVGRWAARRGEIDAEDRRALWAEIVEQAAVVYEKSSARDWQRDLDRRTFDPADDPRQLIVDLRAWIESDDRLGA